MDTKEREIILYRVIQECKDLGYFSLCDKGVLGGMYHQQDAIKTVIVSLAEQLLPNDKELKYSIDKAIERGKEQWHIDND